MKRFLQTHSPTDPHARTASSLIAVHPPTEKTALRFPPVDRWWVQESPILKKYVENGDVVAGFGRFQVISGEFLRCSDFW